MRLLTIFALFFLLSHSTSYSATDRCAQLWKQSELQDNSAARERAAIADLRYSAIRPIKERHSKQEITQEEYVRLTERLDYALRCLEADVELKDYTSNYELQSRRIEGKCQEGLTYTSSAIEYRTSRKAKACAKADLEEVGNLMKQMKDIQAQKLSTEEPPTPTIKQTDPSQKDSSFCKIIRTVSGEAASFFKAIKKERKDPWFIAPDLLSKGSPGVKKSELVEIDSYNVSVTLPRGFLAEPSRCEIQVGTHSNIQVRIAPQYYCQWQFEKTSRRELEERADRLFAIVRGCYDKTMESDDFGLVRHSFVGDASVSITGRSYFGEGKPSSIYIEISKHTPLEDAACTRYGFSKKDSDKALCMKRYSSQ